MSSLKFYFLIPAGTELHTAIKEFMQKADECHKAALEYAKKISGQSVYLGRGGTVMSGGVHALYFPEGATIPEGWSIAKKLQRYKGLPAYTPIGNRKIGKEIHKEKSKLPFVTLWDLNEAVGISNNVFHHPGVSYDHSTEQCILTMSESNLKAWNKPDYVEEITASRFLELTKKEEKEVESE